MYPLIQYFDRAAAERIFANELSAIFFFTDNEEETEAYKAFKSVAKEKNEKIVFSKSSLTKDLGEKLTEYIGIKDTKSETIRIIKFADNDIKKFEMDKEMT